MRKQRTITSYAGQRGAISLWMTAILMMTLTLVAMALLYQWRYGHWPMQDKLDRWSKSATVISNEVKNASGIDSANASNSNPGAVAGDGMAKAANIKEGIRRCTINGRTVYSDSECNGAGSRAVRLHDSQGFEAPKQPPKPDEGEETIEEKMIKKATK